MKLADNPPKRPDKVIAEVRTIKRAISERHGNDTDRLLASLMAQERASGIGQSDQATKAPVPSHSESERPS